MVNAQGFNSLHLHPPDPRLVETDPNSIVYLHIIPMLPDPNLCIFREDGFVGLAIEYQLECNGISERHPDTIQQLIV